MSVGVDPLTRNTYGYVNGDPVNLIDPSGHEPCPKRGCTYAVNSVAAMDARKAGVTTRRFRELVRARRAFNEWLSHYDPKTDRWTFSPAKAGEDVWGERNALIREQLRGIRPLGWEKMSAEEQQEWLRKTYLGLLNNLDTRCTFVCQVAPFVMGAYAGALTSGAAAAESTAAARGGVYSLRDETGNVVRTGRTRDLAAREAAHARDPVLGEYEFRVEYATDAYAEQRGLEQILYDRYPGARFENGGFNKIRGISPSNPNLPEYLKAARDYLERLGLYGKG